MKETILTLKNQTDEKKGQLIVLSTNNGKQLMSLVGNEIDIIAGVITAMVSNDGFARILTTAVDNYNDPAVRKVLDEEYIIGEAAQLEK